MAQATVSAQVRMRAGSMWTPPPPPAMMQTRPLRSSPLAGPAFSTLPTIISESSEESHDEPRSKSSHDLGHTRSPSSSSVVSQAPSGSGYGTGYASGSGSMLVEADGSSSSISLTTSANGTASSQGHGNSLNPKRPARLSKPPGGKGFFARAASESTSVSPGSGRSVSPSLATLPRARTTSGHSRSASLPAQSHLSPPPHSSIPEVYSQTSSRPTSPESSTTHLPVKSNNAEAQNAKQPPSTSRDPAANWMSSSPFGPASTPKFSRLALASPAVVMPLSAREYRKKKAKESQGKVEKELPIPPIRVTFTDSPKSKPSPVQAADISPPPKAPVIVPSVSPPPPRVSPPSSGSGQLRPGHDYDSDPLSKPPPHSQPASPPVPAVIQSTALLKVSVQPRPSSPQKPRSRPNTPPRSSPMAQHLISPKSSTNTFFSFASSEDEITSPPKDTPAQVSAPDLPASTTPEPNEVPPARPRPRSRPRRRKSFPERLSNGGVRLSLLEAVNRLSQEGSPNPISPKNSMNRLSQVSSSTLFYDFSESEKDERDREQEQGRPGTGEAQNPRVSVMHTQSLEDLSSTLARTGIEVVEPDLEDDMGLAEDSQAAKGKRNVRVVRISDTVEVSPPPVPRRRKLTKSRPMLPPVKESKPQNFERRTSLLPWRSKGSGDGHIAVVGAVDAEKSAEDERVLTLTKGLGSTSVAPAATPPPALEDIPPRPESRLAFNTSPTPGPRSSTSAPTPEEESTSTPPRRGRRYTFQFISAPSFHLPKREKSKTEPVPVYMGGSDTGKKGKKKGSKSVESGFTTDSTGTSTVTQGSQTTLTPASAHSSAIIDLTIVTPPRQIPRKEVPDLQTLISQERAKALRGIRPSESGEDSTPSLSTSGSTATSSTSTPGPLPSLVRVHGTPPFVPRPSALKESFTDTSEDDSEGIGRARVYGAYHSYPHHRRDQNALLTATETSEDDERRNRHPAGPRPSSRPGTGSSTLTTATTASYVSFSTVPASTSSPSSSSASLSPSMTEEHVPIQKPNGIVPASLHTDVHHCAHCGHLISQVPVTTNTQECVKPNLSPLFTVPLVTPPPPVVSRPNLVAAMLPRSATPNSRSHSPSTFRMMSTATPKSPSEPQPPVTIVSTPAAAWQQQESTRKSNKHMSTPVPAPVPAHTYSQVPVKLNLSDPPRAVLTRNRPTHVNVTNPVPEYSPELSIAITSATSTQVKRRRPQTAPAGTGDAALKFVEAARLQEGGTFAGNEFGSKVELVASDRKSGGKESKFKSVLKGWLKRS